MVNTRWVMARINPELLMVRGLLLELTQEQRNKVLDTCEKIKQLVNESGDEGKIAIALAAMELDQEAKG